ncbi:MAG TPA: VCBS repeat-containing protein [Verrucomicrobiae bacterium]|nr:VCBS repeat-containing protein [Verrucomicrobiae bacterium]
MSLTSRVLGVVACAALALCARGDDKRATFGFTGPEIFPIDNQISLLHAADLDGDGLTDLIVVNNARSKINILYNQTGKTNLSRERPMMKAEINDLPPDARFRIESIASEKRISSLVVADLNGDKKPDLAYYGDPKELVVQYNLGSNNMWSTPKRWPIDDGQLTVNALASGDLNGDKLTDLVLLGENNLYFLAQTPEHTLAEPKKIPFSGSVKAIQVLDIDGDGRDDLLEVNWDSPEPFRFRLQNSDGELGPEIYFTLPPIRAYLADDLEGNHKTEVVTIAQNSGRAAVSHFVQKPAEPLSGTFKQGQFQVLPLNKSTRNHRGILWADVNGDGLPDLLVAEPDSGQLTLYLQKRDGTLSAAKTFPTLTGVSEIAVGDWNGDGKEEIFLLSSDEHQIGVTKLDEKGRIAFPTILPLDGNPLTMALGPLHAGGKTTLAVIIDQDTNRALVTVTADGKSRSQKLSSDFKGMPSSMTMFDANQDGLADLVVLVPYEKIKVLIQREDEVSFDETDVTPPGGNADEPWLSTLDIDGDGKPELLLAQKNFLRAVVLKPENEKMTNGKPVWSFFVKEQINGASSDSRIVGATPLRNGTNAVPSLFLLDAEKKELTLCERDKAGVWQVVRNLPLPVTDFTSLRSVALGSTNNNSIALIGVNEVGTMAMSGKVWELDELDSYETPIKDGHLADVVAGDLNNDGRKDLVFLETEKNFLDLVTYEPPHRLVPADRWPVFEERTFRSRRNDSIEPREAVVADVTGDGKNDLIVVVHDRILVYPQE